MNAPAFTPWRVATEAGLVMDARQECIADCFDNDAIASICAAAPELYEALEALANDVGAMKADLTNHGSTLGSLIEARTALAKARGEQP